MKYIGILVMTSLLMTGLVAQEPSPEIFTVPADFTRTEIIRLKTGTDMLDGLTRAMEISKIRNGVILSGIGSVSAYHYHVVTDTNLPPAEEFPKAAVPMDLTSTQGYVIGGRVHAHITLSDANSVVGGHLEKGTTALTFIIVTVGVLPDTISLKNFDRYYFLE